MSRREEVGSWIEGAPAGAGRGLGLPTSGRGSRAGLGRRVGALVVDWALASLVSYAFLGYEALATLGVFAVSTVLLVGTAGFTIGHRLLGLQVVRLADLVPQGVADGRGTSDLAERVQGPWFAPGLLLASVRTVLLCLVVPAVVWDSSGRGLHDVAAGTVLVRR